jgi:hypothetical protein
MGRLHAAGCARTGWDEVQSTPNVGFYFRGIHMTKQWPKQVLLTLAFLVVAIVGQSQTRTERQSEQMQSSKAKNGEQASPRDVGLRFFKALRPIVDGMNIVAVDAEAVSVWTSVKKADWPIDAKVAPVSTRGYYLLVPVVASAAPKEAAAASKKPTPTPTPTPEKCYSVVVGSDGELKLDGETPCKKRD